MMLLQSLRPGLKRSCRFSDAPRWITNCQCGKNFFRKKDHGKEAEAGVQEGHLGPSRPSSTHPLTIAGLRAVNQKVGVLLLPPSFPSSFPAFLLKEKNHKEKKKTRAKMFLLLHQTLWCLQGIVILLFVLATILLKFETEWTFWHEKCILHQWLLGIPRWNTWNEYVEHDAFLV